VSFEMMFEGVKR